MTDQPSRTVEVDRYGMLEAIATAGSQIRAGVARAGAALAGLSLGPVRAVLVAGMGGSAAAGDILAVAAGRAARVPVCVHRGYDLPGWVGGEDLVIAVSCSGRTEETRSAAAAAAQRGARLIGVGAPDSPLEHEVRAAGGLHCAVPTDGREPRSCLWGLSTPLLVLADRLGVAAVSESVLLRSADRLDEIAARCSGQVPEAQNPARALAAAVTEGLAMIWGFTEPAAAAAVRFGAQLAENAKLPSVVGTGTEPHHNQVVSFAGPWGADGGSPVLLAPVLLRDAVESPREARRAVESARLATDSGLRVSEVRTAGVHPVERLAGLTGLLDFASAWAAISLGIDPTPVGPIVTLKQRLGTPDGTHS